MGPSDLVRTPPWAVPLLDGLQAIALLWWSPHFWGSVYPCMRTRPSDTSQLRMNTCCSQASRANHCRLSRGRLRARPSRLVCLVCLALIAAPSRVASLSAPEAQVVVPPSLELLLSDAKRGGWDWVPARAVLQLRSHCSQGLHPELGRLLRGSGRGNAAAAALTSVERVEVGRAARAPGRGGRAPMCSLTAL